MIINVALKNGRNISYYAFLTGIILAYGIPLVVLHSIELSEPTWTGEPCARVLNMDFSGRVSVAQGSTW